jgi:hypothetical protein
VSFDSLPIRKCSTAAPIFALQIVYLCEKFELRKAMSTSLRSGLEGVKSKIQRDFDVIAQGHQIQYYILLECNKHPLITNKAREAQ